MWVKEGRRQGRREGGRAGGKDESERWCIGDWTERTIFVGQ